MSLQISSLYPTFGKIISFGWKFFAGGVVVAVAFYSNFVDLKQSRISVEMTGIEQNLTFDVYAASETDFPNLKKLGRDNPYFFLSRKFTLEQLQQIIDQQRHLLQDEKDELGKKKDALNKHTVSQAKVIGKKPGAKTLAAVDIKRMSMDNFNKLDYEAASNAVEDWEGQLSEKDKLLHEAGSEVEKYRHQAENNAPITVTAAVSNTGDGATTLEPQALLRTDLGSGNYLDIDIKVRDYEKGVAEIGPRATKILKFDSDPLSLMAHQLL